MSQTIDKSEVKSILIIKLRGIGDVILSTVVFENLREYFPNAKIDYLTEKPSNIILDKLPFLSEIILFNRKSTLARFKQIFSIRRKKYDLVLDFFSNPSTALITYFSGAKYKAGFPYDGRKYAYNIFGPEERDKFHAAELHLEFLKKIGVPVNSDNLQINLDENSLKSANEFVEKNYLNEKLLIGISPSGGWASKKCDPIKFAEIADKISEKYNSNSIVLWGPGDEQDADEIIRLMKTKVILAPNTDIQGMAAFLKVCDLVVANDSGPMHISTAIGTPVLSLHGPTSPHLQGPYGKKHEWIRHEQLDCIECNKLVCPKNHECFLDLQIDDIMIKIEIMISKNNIRVK